MKENIEHPAYELLQRRALPDLHSEGYYFRHKKSGARVVVLANEDPNKVFYIGFRTTPQDSTGVAHIIEHTVLCGSEKFPVKDPFIELVKGSMNTFLNAMTYPDKTVYPVASCNDQDFKNLMDVYMDAVLHPNIYQEKNIFRQEGWHYELDDPEGELTLNGVVYSEMKGEYSSPDSVAERELQRSLYPDTPYSYDSGGDPDVIPDLTYEDYLDFHRRFYHPSNAYLYLYGDMDAEERLDWLDRAYLSAYEAIDPDSDIPMQPAFDAPRILEKEYPISNEESEEHHTYLTYNWSVGTNLDPVQYVAFDILSYALLNSHGAPVKQALLDAGIGDDIYGGYDGGIQQPVFTVIAKNAQRTDRDEFEKVIHRVLKEQAEQGIHRETLLSAINGAEFKFREADFGRFPKGLMFGLQMLDSWLYDETKPFLYLDELSVYEKLRAALDTGYFEDLIRTDLLENRHATIVSLIPRKGLNAEREQALKEHLAAYRASLGEEEIARLIAETAELAAYEEEPSAPEDLAKIPLLSREDMKKTADPFCNEEETLDGVPFLWHDYETNGILYLDYLFDLSHIPEEEVPYLGLLKTLLGCLDTADYSYVDLDNAINLHTGGITAEVSLFDRLESDRAYAPYFEIRIRTLVSNLEKAMDLAGSMMLRTCFDDEKRLFEVLAQTRSQMQSALQENGNSFALHRVMSYTFEKAHYDDLLGGIGQYRLLERIVDQFAEEKEDLKAALQSLLSRILQPGRLLVSVTGRRPEYEAVRRNASRITEGLYADEEAPGAARLVTPARVNEAFTDAGQVQYVAAGGTFSDKGFSWSGTLRVFRCIMNYDYLWMNLRVRGGAYGCGCTVGRTGEIGFASYRDPNLSRTLMVYRGVPEYLEEFEASERDMTRFVIGTFGEMDAPLTPRGQGRRSLAARIAGFTREMIQRDREEILAATAEDIRALAPLLRAALEGSYRCVIGSEEKIREESELFEVTEAL